MPSPFGTPWVTGDDVTELALKFLGVTAAGQSVDPEDRLWASEQLQPMFAKLAALEICYTPQLDAIPVAWFEDLASILAGICAPKFGATTDDHVRWVSGGLGGPPSPVPLGA